MKGLFSSQVLHEIFLCGIKKTFKDLKIFFTIIVELVIGVFKLGIEPVKVELVKLYVELVVNVELSVLLDNAYVVVEVAYYFLSKIKFT